MSAEDGQQQGPSITFVLTEHEDGSMHLGRTCSVAIRSRMQNRMSEKLQAVLLGSSQTA